MAVAFDATTAGVFGGNNTTSFSNTPITVGAGANRALVVMIAFAGTAANTPPTGISVTWDSGGTNQAMTLINSVNNPTPGLGNGYTLQTYGLVAPTSGAKTLAISWTKSNDFTIAAVSVTGANQAGGAATFANWTSAENTGGASATNSVTVTSAVGDLVVAQHIGGLTGAATAYSSTNNTALYTGGTTVKSIGAANRAAGAASVTLTATQDAADVWASQGVNIKAFVAAPSGGSEWPNPQQRRPLLLGHTASFQLPLQQVLPPRQTDWPVPTGRTLFCDWIYSNVAARPPLIFPDTRQTDWPNPTLPRPPLNVGDTQFFALAETSSLPLRQVDWPNPTLPRPPPNVGSTNSFELSYQQVLPPTNYDWPNPRGSLPIFRDWTASFNLSSQQTLPPGQFGWTVPRPRLPVVSDWIYPASHTLILPPPVISRARMYDWPVPRGPRRSIDLLTIANQIMRAPPGPPIAGGPREILKNETGRVRTLKNERLRVRWLTKL